MSMPSIPLAQHAERRRRLAEAIGPAVAVVFAGEDRGHLSSSWRPHPHFEYLTGLVDEPEAVLVLDPTNPVESRRDAIFLRPLNPELEKWDGYRLELGKALRDRTGFTSVFRTTFLPRFLAEAARRARRLACVHPFAWHDQPVSPDLALFRRIAERVPGVEIVDRTEAPLHLRSVKSDEEVAMIRRAVEITGEALRDALSALRPGLSEFDVQEAIEHGYRTRGSRGPAYASIVGTGLNSTVLHYKANRAPIADGDLICIDTGASFGSYGADITRTVPANGRFTERQRAIYAVVLEALEAATALVKPGATIAQLDAAARAVIGKAGYGDFFIHGIGHHLGIETHDATPQGALEAGNVITIEPGIYIPDERIGVRLEDDVLVTAGGCEVLSHDIPRDPDAIERMIG